MKSRSRSPSVEALVKPRSSSLENTQLRRSQRTPTDPSYTLKRKSIPDIDLFEPLTPEHELETFDESDEYHQREDDSMGDVRNHVMSEDPDGILSATLYQKFKDEFSDES